MIRILVAEDHVIARVGVITIVNKQRDMTVVAAASNGNQTVRLYRTHVPDILLLDLRMPVLSGLDAASAIRTEFPEARIIALTTYGGAEDIRRALNVGVQSYLTKDLVQDQLLKAIREVHAGRSYVPDSLATLVKAQMARPTLTERELQVLELVVRGQVNKQIAYSLNLAEYTVKNYVKKILAKLEVQDRTQAATVALERGIIHLS
jgi:two-component system NarL family response regulator